MAARKTALVTGAARGIGKAIALELARRGFDVAINDIVPEEKTGTTLADFVGLQGRAIYARADISQREQRAALVDRVRNEFGRLDLLVNNAGIAPRQRLDLLQATEESFDEVLAVNLKGPYFLTQLVARWMIALQKTLQDYQPRIINISSMSAYTSSPARGEYCISKAGVSMMTKLYADRLAEFGIPVFEIRPGVIHTQMTAPVREKYDKLIGEGLTPIRRWGEPQDVAQAVAAIAEGYLPFSTGETINVDGGFHLRRL
ncbi:3-ketoacyl-ACP reductase [candidate division BRC1 bacterium SM23_51]|nr:MAG: 3-ketoacyl-ACP reductase [candidate division BRC1 bacterium SM23_51]